MACMVAGLLGDLHTERNRADDQLVDPSAGAPDVARLCVETANEILSDLNECEKSQAKIRHGIDAYLVRIGNSQRASAE